MENYGVALSFVPGMTTPLARRMSEAGMTPEEFFKLDSQTLSSRLMLKDGVRFDRMQLDEALFRARKEQDFMDRHHVRAYCVLDDDYPFRLSDIDKAPLVLYKLGNADLDASKMLSIVGTRRATQYGARYVQSLVSGLAPYFPGMTIVSGLALGIDTFSHVAALDAGLPTIGVVAHGLNTIYPASNRSLAARMIASGGAVLSEYPSGTPIYRGRFLERNRIVATMTDAVLVAESAEKGGAMSTAAVASSYGRELLALPGRLGDEMSTGCNRLIRSGKAMMAGSVADVMTLLGWQPENVRIDTKQRDLFPELAGDDKLVYDCLRHNSEPMPIDAIRERTGLPIHSLMTSLGDMEFDGIVERLPGNRFSLISY